MGNYEIVYYSKPNGREPLREFLESLSPKLSSEAFSDLATLQEMGPELRMPHSRHIRKGLFELRIQADGDNVRAFYFFYQRRSIVVTHGFLKKTRKTPLREIERAFRYKHDWEKRHNA